ncbi:hypothetical protein [Brachybacterium hainanense]|uniref:Uncharacterized protein n=1 Tax=Brachybacterium hainanense TaxID=1541174 RepID=A0ABV6RGI8_9MICO
MPHPRDLTLPADAPRASRRALMKGIAWAAPVASIAIAAPAIASSNQPPIDVSLGGDSCKWTEGHKQYYITFDIANNRNYAVEYRVIALTVTPNSGSTITFTETLPTEWTEIGVGEDSFADFLSNQSNNIAQGTANVTFEVRKVGEQDVEQVTGTFVVSELPPCQEDPPIA